MLGKARELVRLLRSQRRSADELATYQTEQLRRVVRHAYENVPYYRSLFRGAGLVPEDIRTLDDLRHLPISTKQALRAAGVDRTTARNTDRAALQSLRTSGTTGSPFTVYLTQGERRTRRLLEFRALLIAGFRPADRLVYLGPYRRHHSGAHQRLGWFRSAAVSGLLPPVEQIADLRRLKPSILWAYPTTLAGVLHEIGHCWDDLMRPRALITSSESLPPRLRERIVCELDPEMFDFYGAMEFGRIAAECRAHQGLHVNADHVIVECLDPDNRPVEPGTSGTVVVTALKAFAMPFIRYRLGDTCVPLARRCPCGSSFPLIGPVAGRDDPLMPLPSGRRIAPIGLEAAMRGFADEIEQYRFIQHTPGQVTVELAMRSPLSEATLDAVRVRLDAYIGEPVDFRFELYDVLPTRGAKFQAFVSRCSTQPVALGSDQ